MNILFKYTKANIRSNKSRIPMIIICVAVAVMMFFTSIIVPKVFDNFFDLSKSVFYGDSDINIMNSGNNYVKFDTTINFPDIVRQNSEYVVHMFAINGVVKKDTRELSINVLGVSLDHLQTYNPLTFREGERVSQLKRGDVIISRGMAEEFGYKIGDTYMLQYQGVDYPGFRVAGIAENEGLFRFSSNENIIVSRDSVSAIIKLNTNYLFNICLVKLKDPSMVDWAIEQLEASFPEFAVKNSQHDENLQTSLQQNKVPFLICAIIVCLFCLFIIYLTMGLVFSERVKQFATMKSMGATTFSLFRSSMLESVFYGLVGGGIGIILSFIIKSIAPFAFGLDMFTGIGIPYYLIALVFGMVSSVVCAFIPAISSLRFSVRQTMIIGDEKSKKTHFWLQVLGLLLLLITVVVVIFQKQGQNKVLSAVIVLLGISSLILLTPYLINYTLKIVNKIFRRKNFTSIYNKNTFINASTGMVTRILTFALTIVIMLTAFVDTVGVLAEGRINVPYYNAKISRINNGGAGVYSYVSNLRGVEEAYATVCFSSVKLVKTNSNIREFKGMTADDVTTVYSSLIINKDVALAAFRETENAALLNVRYNYIEGYQINEEVDIYIQSVDKTVTVKVVGFIDSMEQDTNFIVTKREFLAEQTDVLNFNEIVFRVTDEYHDQVMGKLRTQYNALSYSIVSVVESRKAGLKMFEWPLLVFQAYNGVIIVLSTLCVVIGLMLALRKTIHVHKTMNLLGMDKPAFLKAFMMQMLYMIVGSILTSMFIIFMLITSFENVVLLAGLYIPITTPWLDMLMMAGICGVVVLIASFFMANNYVKKFSGQTRMVD